MSKKDKNIQITEEEKMVNGQLVTELTAKKSKLGQVIADQVIADQDKFIAVLPSGERFNVKTENEALDLLIRDFHLHRG